jgi:hypothetical protein
MQVRFLLGALSEGESAWVRPPILVDSSIRERRMKIDPIVPPSDENRGKEMKGGPEEKPTADEDPNLEDCWTQPCRTQIPWTRPPPAANGTDEKEKKPERSRNEKRKQNPNIQKISVNEKAKGSRS